MGRTLGPAALVALGVAATTLVTPAARAGAPAEVTAEAPAAVLGLEADDSHRGAALTVALRRSLAKRGLSGGGEANLAELRLMLGCESNDPACLAGGGATLDARRLVYGTLSRVGDTHWSLVVIVLEVDTARVAESVNLPLTDDDLLPTSIDRTADRVAELLAPDTTVGPDPVAGIGNSRHAEPVEAPPWSDRSEPEPSSRRPRRSDRPPAPRWKWVGFGTSAGLFTVGLVSTIGTGAWLTSKNGGFRRELLQAAQDSLSDANSLNDVDPNVGENVSLCDLAQAQPTDDDGMPLGQPGQVRNSAVVSVCNKAKTITKIQLTSAIVAGIGGVSTVVFGVLLLLERRKAGKASAWRRRAMHVTLDPGPTGATLRWGGRF